MSRTIKKGTKRGPNSTVTRMSSYRCILTLHTLSYISAKSCHVHYLFKPAVLCFAFSCYKFFFFSYFFSLLFSTFFFFFSSRRRHTRLQGDWSSDVCSS